jgi:hypothetical protein
MEKHSIHATAEDGSSLGQVSNGMNKIKLASNFVLVGGILLFITGLGHLCTGIPQFNEAVSKGLINLLPMRQIDWQSQSLAKEEIELAWIVFGLNMNIFGLIIMFLSSELKKGKKTAWNINLTIGLFYLIIGLVAAFYFRVAHPANLLFPVIGLVVSIPLLIYRHKFNVF